MRKSVSRNNILAALLWLALASNLPLPAATIYDNTVNDLTTRFHTGMLEAGDEIILASTERYLTNFSFEYFGTNTAGSLSFSGTVQARVRFYENNGDLFNGYAMPGTNFYDSGWFDVSATPRSTVDFTAGSDFPTGGLFMPVASNMTWSVQFQGMGANDDVGVDLFSPPTVGGNTPDYWQNTGSSWALETNSLAVDFASKFEAAPEPSTVAISVVGIGIFLATRRLRKNG